MPRVHKHPVNRRERERKRERDDSDKIEIGTPESYRLLESEKVIARSEAQNQRAKSTAIIKFNRMDRDLHLVI